MLLCNLDRDVMFINVADEPQIQTVSIKQSWPLSAVQHSTALLKSCRQLFWLGGQQILTWKKYPSKESNPCPLEVRLVELTPRTTRDPDDPIVNIARGLQILKNFSK